ncbi:hypothetical protein BSKO_00747 [Bryopsis sp. KO-2023]|nr:hypothetical protein BSKO_00747 [Bryopsis sp. KO-2023]
MARVLLRGNISAHNSRDLKFHLLKCCSQRGGRRVVFRPRAASPSSGGGTRTMGSELLSVAPMMEYTDIHFRSLARILSRRTWLYTEMVVDSTIRHNPNTDRFLAFPPEQHPVACQLGGSNPENLAEAAKIVAAYGYDEINLNCGCPSDRVAGAGCFGAKLMLTPDTVAACMQAMGDVVDVPVTVKCRLGVDDYDSYEELCNFVKTVSETSAVGHFILHARKCLLNGLSPHQNRTIPPLRHEWVYALKRDFPELEFSLNGGIKSLEQTRSILDHRLDENLHVRSVMIGRAAYEKPWDILSNADKLIFGEESNPAISRYQALLDYAAIADSRIGSGGIDSKGKSHPSMRVLVKPALNMFHGQKGCKKFKQAVDKHLIAGVPTVTELFEKSMAEVPEEVLHAPPLEPEEMEPFATGGLPPPVVLRSGSDGVERLLQTDEAGPSHVEQVAA